MSEIKCLPSVTKDINGDDIVAFDADHTLSDIIRYLLTQTDRDELRYLIEHVEEPVE